MEKKIDKRVGKEDDGMRLEHFLRRKMLLTKREISRAKFRELGICVNGERRKVNALLKAGDLVEVILETGEESSKGIKAFQGMISVLYEDGDVIVVDKPSGLKVHPTGGRDEDTLANRLAAYLREKGEDSVIRIVGRLDKDTSGAVLAVKNRGAALRLQYQREEGTMSKTYLAIVEGRPKPAEGWIELPLRLDPEDRRRMETDSGGKRAVTYYETLSADENEEGRKTLLRVRLLTGRMHQIRIHMASIGCPLLGDSMYGNGAVSGMERTALHAQYISFRQPFTREKIQVEAEMPEDMKQHIPIGNEPSGNASMSI